MAALVAVSPAFNLLRFGVAVLLLSVAVAATRVPGLKWDALQVWEGSALPGAWDDVEGYLDFRTYALDLLSDLGFLDVLLDDRFRDWMLRGELPPDLDPRMASALSTAPG